MIKLYKLYFFHFIVGLIFLTSCKKFIEINPPKNLLEDSAIFSDSTNATGSILGIYIKMMQSFSLNLTTGGVTIYTGMSADELKPFTNNAEDEEFYKNSLLASNFNNSIALWSHGYNLIYNTNACIEGISKSDNISESVKKQLIGEARFIRAFIFFQLTNLYGPIPLPISTNYNGNKLLPKAMVSDVYAQIQSDLIEAENALPINYISPNRLRPNQYTATALLAKVYLYQEKWMNAEALASKIINSGIYSLENDLNNIFLSTSNEAIWKLSPVFPGFETWEGYYIVPTNTLNLPKYVISEGLLNTFDSVDKRKKNWLNRNVVGGQNYYYPYKYKLRQTSTTSMENYVVFRLAEQYLIRAEARTKQNNLTGAISDLNKIRTRAGISALPDTLTQSELINLIEMERRMELFCEWGNRWFDLKRTNRAEIVLAPLKSEWHSTDVLYPIPQTELQLNPKLTQNLGY